METAKSKLSDIAQQMADELKGTGHKDVGTSGASECESRRQLTANTISQYFKELAPKVVGEKQDAIAKVMELLHDIDSQDILAKAADSFQLLEEVWDESSVRECAEQAIAPLGEDAPEEHKTKRHADVEALAKTLGSLKGKQKGTSNVRRTINKGGTGLHS